MTLNNAQSGGPQIVITEDGIIQTKIWLRDERSEDKGIYFSETPSAGIYITTKERIPLSAFPNKDGMVLYEASSTVME